MEPADQTSRMTAGELFIIINPGSGEHDPRDTRAVLKRVFGEAGQAFSFVDIQSPAQLATASDGAAAKALACDGAIVAVGGDGTINAVARAAWGKGCKMGALPQGTFNYFGRANGIPQDLEPAARALLRADEAPAQVGLVNGRVFLVNASLGLYPQLLQDREAFKQRFGRHRSVAIVSALVTLFEWRRQLVLRIEEDGEKATMTTPTLFVGNNPLQLGRIGIGEETVGRVGAGRLAAVLASPIGTWRMLALLARGAFGTLGEADQVTSFAFRKMTVNVLGRKRVKVATDGEIFAAATPLVFEVAPKPLRLLLPREADRVAVA